MEELLTRQLPATLALTGTGRVREAVIATEDPVTVYDRSLGRAILESLSLDGLTVAADIPLLSDHDRSVRSTIGTASDFRRDGSRMQARLRFASGTVASDEAWSLVESGHVRGLSVGYSIEASETIPAGVSRTIGAREFRAPPDQSLRVVTRWTLREVSLTPIAADVSAGIRSENLFHWRNQTMVFAVHDQTQDRANAQTTKALEAMCFHLGRNDTIRAPELFARALQAIGMEAGDGDHACVRTGLSIPAVADAFTTLATVRVDNGFDAVPDSLAGIRTVVDLDNFKERKALVASGAGRMELLARGGTADELWFGIAPETIRLKRYAGRAVFAEEDLIDQAESINLQLLGADEMGRAAKRLVLDLAWGLLLSNPTLGADSTPVFHTNHSNYGTGGGSSLQQSSLATAMGAIANQTLPDEEGNNVHVNIPARHLRVSPVLLEPARRLARDLVLGDGSDLTVMPESRMSATGFVDPATDEVVTGSATCWLLAGDPVVAPSLLVGAMGGRLRPQIRGGQLTQGEWGVWIDVVFDVGVAIADYRALYFSAGA